MVQTQIGPRQFFAVFTAFQQCHAQITASLIRMVQRSLSLTPHSTILF